MNFLFFTIITLVIGIIAGLISKNVHIPQKQSTRSA